MHHGIRACVDVCSPEELSNAKRALKTAICAYIKTHFIYICKPGQLIIQYLYKSVLIKQKMLPILSVLCREICL